MSKVFAMGQIFQEQLAVMVDPAVTDSLAEGAALCFNVAAVNVTIEGQTVALPPGSLLQKPATANLMAFAGFLDAQSVGKSGGDIVVVNRGGFAPTIQATNIDTPNTMLKITNASYNVTAATSGDEGVVAVQMTDNGNDAAATITHTAFVLPTMIPDISTAYIAADTALLATLAAVTNGNGAAKIGVEDAGNLLTAATVEAALAELAQSSDTIAATGACSVAQFKKGVILATCAAATDITLPATGLPIGAKCTFIKTAGSTNELKLSATALVGPGSTSNEATGADAIGDSYTVTCIANDSYVITAINLAS